MSATGGGVGVFPVVVPRSAEQEAFHCADLSEVWPEWKDGRLAANLQKGDTVPEKLAGVLRKSLGFPRFVSVGSTYLRFLEEGLAS